MKIILGIFLIMSFVSCSGSKSVNKTDGALDEAGTELSDEGSGLADEIGLDDEGVFATDDKAEGASEDVGFDESFADDDSFAEEDSADEASNDVVQEDISPVVNQNMDFAPAAPAASIEMTGSNGVYNVQAGDTLMIIAFKIYGDYDKWRSLASLNAGRLGANHSVRVGMTLNYNEPSQKFVWNPSGNPYLIRSGDTLGTISRDTYGNMSFWKNIWDNNRPMIKDPNRIFAGFTLYTPVIEARGVATKGANELVNDVANEEI